MPSCNRDLSEKGGKNSKKLRATPGKKGIPKFNADSTPPQNGGGGKTSKKGNHHGVEKAPLGRAEARAEKTLPEKGQREEKTEGSNGLQEKGAKTAKKESDRRKK